MALTVSLIEFAIVILVCHVNAEYIVLTILYMFISII